MKIVVSSTGGDMISKVDPRFGRAPFFVFIEEDGKGELRHYAVENPAAGAPSGAGTEAAQQVVREGASVVISGAVGPNAFEVFEKLGISVFPVQGDLTVEEAYKRYKEGSLQKMVMKRL
ncbi:MAG: dinitrogenase iron-molybdenum cofactor biosynthesis protein [Deltaproteobacteria bacterium]|nr:MAG: dinitrogenase iron-molybdenum cofactor biosynthesis protein [Deltaproteobacteria bacterium]